MRATTTSGYDVGLHWRPWPRKPSTRPRIGVGEPRPVGGSGVVPVSLRPCSIRFVLAMIVVNPVDMPVGLDVLLREQELVPLGRSACGRLAGLPDLVEDPDEHIFLAARDERDEPESPPALTLERVYFERTAFILHLPQRI